MSHKMPLNLAAAATFAMAALAFQSADAVPRSRAIRRSAAPFISPRRSTPSARLRCSFPTILRAKARAVLSRSWRRRCRFECGRSTTGISALRARPGNTDACNGRRPGRGSCSARAFAMRGRASIKAGQFSDRDNKRIVGSGAPEKIVEPFSCRAVPQALHPNPGERPCHAKCPLTSLLRQQSPWRRSPLSLPMPTRFAAPPTSEAPTRLRSALRAPAVFSGAVIL
jgi:hypothetical protein